MLKIRNYLLYNRRVFNRKSWVMRWFFCKIFKPSANRIKITFTKIIEYFYKSTDSLSYFLAVVNTID